MYVNPTDGKILGSKEITLQDGGMHHDMQGGMECMSKMGGMHGGDHGQNHGGMQCMSKMDGMHGDGHGAHHDGAQGEYHASGHGAGKGC